MLARVCGDNGVLPPGAASLNHVMNCFISPGTRLDGGASKCTVGLWIGPETTWMDRSPLSGMQCQPNIVLSVSGSAKSLQLGERRPRDRPEDDVMVGEVNR